MPVALSSLGHERRLRPSPSRRLPAPRRQGHQRNRGYRNRPVPPRNLGHVSTRRHRSSAQPCTLQPLVSILRAGTLTMSCTLQFRCEFYILQAEEIKTWYKWKLNLVGIEDAATRLQW